jgi:hypothetical protein
MLFGRLMCAVSNKVVFCSYFIIIIIIIIIIISNYGSFEFQKVLKTGEEPSSETSWILDFIYFIHIKDDGQSPRSKRFTIWQFYLFTDVICTFAFSSYPIFSTTVTSGNL